MEKGIFDTHAHYEDEKFKKNKTELLLNMQKNGVEKICNVGTSLEESKKSIELANEYDFIFSSVGIHPFYAESLEKNWEEKFLKLAKSKKVVAIGEAGLDYSAKEFSKKKQFEIFEKQLNIAEKLNLPIIIHSRDAKEDTLAIVKNFPKVKGVVHCFSEDFKTALEYVKLNYFIGFTGIVTFKNADKTKKAAESTPKENLVVETDCPYMAPEPLRGKICESSMIKYILQKIAEIKNLSYSELLLQTRDNAFKLYKFKEKMVN